MRIKQLRVAGIMTLKDLVRRKIVIILLFVIPSVFYTVTRLTTGMKEMPFRLASFSEETILTVPERHVALVFMGLASAGLLSAFLSMNLIQRYTATNRRLIICGYRTTEIALSKLLVMAGMIVVLGFYIASMLFIFFSPDHFLKLVTGFVLVGFVYGSYGLFIGAILKGELEGILLIALLANIDVGWLQNPIFYADALNKSIIRGLPAFHPSQASIISAFSDHEISGSLAGSLLYGSAFLLLALLIYWLKMKKAT